MELQRALPDYERVGLAVFAISYDPVSALAAFAEKHGITYPLLSDQGSIVIRRLGLLNEQVQEQHAAFGIPYREGANGVAYPGAFILDRDGIVHEKRFLENYRERETGAALLEQAFGSESAAHGPEQRASGPGVAGRAYLDAPAYRLAQRRWLTVELQIGPGLHVFGRPIPGGYVPLELSVAPIEGITVGEVQATAPRPFQIAGLEEQFHVHEGRVVLRLPLTFQRRVEAESLPVRLRYQACSATDCLPPGTLELALPLVAENLVDLDR